LPPARPTVTASRLQAELSQPVPQKLIEELQGITARGLHAAVATVARRRIAAHRLEISQLPAHALRPFQSAC